MGDERHGCLVSGIGIAAAAAAALAPPAPPLSASVTWVGDNPLLVSGASGVPMSKDNPWTPNVLSYTRSGGAGPYNETGGLTNNLSGKLYLAASANGATTVGWNNMVVNEIQNADIFYTVVDSTGSIATSSTSITIRRNT